MKRARTIKGLILMLVLSLSTLAGCKHHPIFDVSNLTVDTTHHVISTRSKDTVYFNNTILPMIISSCAVSTCHDATTHAEDLNLTTYAGIMRIVRPNNANGSNLYTTIVDGNMPRYPVSAMTADQLALIRKWIEQGAKNNTCTETACDSIHVSYSGTIAPILKLYCTGCHNSSSSSGGINLDNYTSASANANNGQIMGAVLGKTGFIPMPQAGNRLSTCNIAEIRKWITDGTPNN